MGTLLNNQDVAPSFASLRPYRRRQVGGAMIQQLGP